MQCPGRNENGAELFIGYAADTLRPDEKAALQAHLQVCLECSRIADAQRAVWAALESWEPLAVSPDFDAKVFRRIAADDERPWYKSLFDLNWSMRPVMPVAAACVAVLCAFLLKSPLIENTPARAEVKLEQNKVDIEQVERALDDLDMLQQLGVVPAVSKPDRGSHRL